MRASSKRPRIQIGKILYYHVMSSSTSELQVSLQSWTLDNQSPPIISVTIDLYFLLPELMHTSLAKLVAKFQYDSSSCSWEKGHIRNLKCTLKIWRKPLKMIGNFWKSAQSLPFDRRSVFTTFQKFSSRGRLTIKCLTLTQGGVRVGIRMPDRRLVGMSGRQAWRKKRTSPEKEVGEVHTTQWAHRSIIDQHKALKLGLGLIPPGPGYNRVIGQGSAVLCDTSVLNGEIVTWYK